MPDPFPFPYAEVAFDKSGHPVSAATRAAAVALVTAPEVTDVLVISHGWNNDMDEARALYAELAGSMSGVLASNAPAAYGDRQLAVVGVLWPSKKFADADLIPGGAAAVGHGATADDVRAELAELTTFVGTAAATKAQAKALPLVDRLTTDPAAADRFVDLVRGMLQTGEAATDGQDAAAQFFALEPRLLMDNLQRPVFVGKVTHAPGGASRGGAAGFGDALAAKLRAARNLLNFATYYQMKARAGVVGAAGVAPLLEDLHEARGDLRLHLAGHSFGARVVSMAAHATSPAVPVASMSLLQGAFSHYGFATDWDGKSDDGAFLDVLTSTRLTGPVVITHTANDKAVGIAYALASRVAGQVAQSVGGPDDKYGGLGRNGALKTGGVGTTNESLLADDAAYDLSTHRVHNLLADAFVHDHSDVRGREVALAVLSAIATGPVTTSCRSRPAGR